MARRDPGVGPGGTGTTTTGTGTTTTGTGTGTTTTGTGTGTTGTGTGTGTTGTGTGTGTTGTGTGTGSSGSFDPFGGILSGIFGTPTEVTEETGTGLSEGPDLPSNIITQTTESATFQVTNPTDEQNTTYELNKERSVDAQLSQAIQQSMTAYPEKWAEATGTTNVQKQFESVTGFKIPLIFGGPGSNADTNGHIIHDPIPGETPGPGLGPGAVTLDGAEVPGVDYFASALAFFQNILGGASATDDPDTVSDADLPIEPQVDAGNLVGPGPDVPNGPDFDGAEIIFDPDRCVRVANQLIADPNVESRFKNLAKWYKGSNLPCDTFFNDVSYAANLNQIGGVTQRQIQLEALGLASEDISRSLDQEAAVREAQRIEDIDYITEVNTRLSDDVVNLGDAALSLQQQVQDLGNALKEGQAGECAWYDIPCKLGEIGKSAAVPVVIIGGGILAAWFLLKRRRG